MKINTDPKKINEVLTRGVEQVLPNKKNLARLMQKRRIRLYLGIDPTGPNLHLGHTIAMRKIQQFADLGHEAILVIGTGTVLTGDPSQRETKRDKITAKEIRSNIKTWKKQAEKILDFSKVKLVRNGDWLLKLKYSDIIDIASRITAVKLWQREMFQRRLKNGDTIWEHETLYPLFQGYDSVHLKVDLEVGGTDQTFNMLIGRDLARSMINKEKFVLTCPMILGTDGRQMSKTSRNCIWILDSPKEKYGKIMSIPDQLTLSYLELLTDLPLVKTKKLKPREAKAKLAFEIVRIYHSEKTAQEAEREFNRVFKERKLPGEIPTIIIKNNSLNILDLLVKTKLSPSKLEAKRLILQKGVKIDGQTQKDWRESVRIKKGLVLQAGKRRFVKIN